MARSNYYIWPRWDLTPASSSWQWNASVTSNEYYITKTGGSSPAFGGAVDNLTDPPMVEENGSDMTQGTVGSLSVSQFDWGDNDSIGFSTLYVRLADNADPDTKAAGFVKAGGNNTGSGTTEATAFETVQYALDNVTQGADGDNFHLKSGAADVLTAALNLTTYTVTTRTQPLIIQGYSSAIRDGGIGEIDNNNFSLFSTAYDSISMIDMKFGNSSTNFVWRGGTFCNMIRCEAHTCAREGMLSFGRNFTMIGCWIHGWTYGSLGYILSRYDNVLLTYYGLFGSTLKNNFIDCGSVYNLGILLASHCNVIGNIIKTNHVNARGLETGDSVTGEAASFQATSIINNSIFNASAGVNSGINLSLSYCKDIVIINNIIEGWSGTGGRPIKKNASSDDALSVYGNNLFYNNDTNNHDMTDYLPLCVFPDIVASASPFTNTSTNDFTPTSEAQGLGLFPLIGGVVDNDSYEDIGACQITSSGGGGGGATKRFSSA